jgi:large conductance mechanosensitive channel
MKKFLQEFKAFINKGNVVDMAVAVIIGGAFTPIVNAIVNNIIMPVIGVLVGNIDFSDLKTVLVEEVLDESGAVVTAEVAIGWGVLIGAVLNFLIIALCIFLLLKGILMAESGAKKAGSKLKKGEKEEAPAPEAPAEPAAPVETDVDLLREIRDLLKKQENS